MSNWNNTWKFSTARFTVSLDWEYEQSPDLSWADDETNEKLESGEYINCTFRVRVLCDGREVGADYLGNSIYTDPHSFYVEHLGVRAKSRAEGCNYGCYFTDMVATAIDEARKALADMPRLRSVA